MTKNLLVIHCSLFASEVQDFKNHVVAQKSREISQYQVHLKKICANLYPATNIKIHHILWCNNDMMLQTYVHGISIEHRFVQIATHAIRDSWTKKTNFLTWSVTTNIVPIDFCPWIPACNYSLPDKTIFPPSTVHQIVWKEPHQGSSDHLVWNRPLSVLWSLYLILFHSIWTSYIWNDDRS